MTDILIYIFKIPAYSIKTLDSNTELHFDLTRLMIY